MWDPGRSLSLRVCGQVALIVVIVPMTTNATQPNEIKPASKKKGTKLELARFFETRSHEYFA